MGPQTQRVAIRDGNRFTENYLGVMFLGGPDTLEPGDTADVRLALMYFPEYPYEEVQPGTTFTVREGSLVVGYGVIRSREMESFPLPLLNRAWSDHLTLSNSTSTDYSNSGVGCQLIL
jgi:hypothetical protein